MNITLIYIAMTILMAPSSQCLEWKAEKYLTIPWGSADNQINRDCLDCPDPYAHVVSFAVGLNGEVAVGDWSGFIKLYSPQGKMISKFATENGWRNDICFGKKGELYYLEYPDGKTGVIMRRFNNSSSIYYQCPGDSILQLDAIDTDEKYAYAYLLTEKRKMEESSHRGYIIPINNRDNKGVKIVNENTGAILAKTRGRRRTEIKEAYLPTPLGVDGRHNTYVAWGYDDSRASSELHVLSNKGKVIASAYFPGGMESLFHRPVKLGQDDRLYIDNSDKKSFILWVFNKP